MAPRLQVPPLKELRDMLFPHGCLRLASVELPPPPPTAAQLDAPSAADDDVRTDALLDDPRTPSSVIEALTAPTATVMRVGRPASFELIATDAYRNECPLARPMLELAPMEEEVHVEAADEVPRPHPGRIHLRVTVHAAGRFWVAARCAGLEATVEVEAVDISLPVDS